MTNTKQSSNNLPLFPHFLRAARRAGIQQRPRAHLARVVAVALQILPELDVLLFDRVLADLG